ncbi:Uncharacterised protein [Salmonella enterica subsp. enterica serovar Heidelberg]|nr:Uncharacterised protein [Salmonella enterica subsp. enterica serovar Heidelberg]SUG79998.1 Uncharacterised protein [Salmonella enterica subsp. enterica]
MFLANGFQAALSSLPCASGSFGAGTLLLLSRRVTSN